MLIRVGFLNNQIDNRGTGNAVYNYAHYNEEILGNQSKIFTFPNAAHDDASVSKFVHRFGSIWTPTTENLEDIDVLYHIKSGEDDEFFPRVPRYVVHAVFSPQPHGDRYAVISEWMSQKYNLPNVPHIIQLPDISENYRQVLKISDDSTVFGRIGGWDSFDIPWVWDSIKKVLNEREDVYFLFVNTMPVFDHPRILYFPATLDENAKRAFINTTDAMLHARNRGETFGIAVGEFAWCGKPIFTFDGSYERSHMFELRGTAITYKDKNDLTEKLLSFHRVRYQQFYKHFDPKTVMAKFKRIFLDD